MIAQLEGSVSQIAQDLAVISVAGIGFAVRMPSSNLAHLHVGTHVFVHTYLSVSQDALSLYGFLDNRSKDLFLRLQKVPGIGPKAALSLLSAMTVDQLLTAIGKQDVTALTKAKGVGRRGAQKVILELSGKIADLDADGDTDKLPRNISEVIDGLTSLGWHTDEARAAVDAVLQDEGIAGDIPDDRVPDILRRCLAVLGRSRK